MPLVECVPNVSEGRNRDSIAAMERAIRDAGGARILDVMSDAAHNRTVFTFVAEPAALRGPVLALYEAALSRIDLRAHRGEHPRMGAVDVCPFVPVRDATIERCVGLAEEIGREVAARFRLPVYLYAAAARLPNRRSLPEIRKGEFEGFAAKIREAEWAPDFGPAEVHATGGVTAIGARPFLIAYNVNLKTRDLELARRIARELRESSGGLARVQAKGMDLPEKGMVQVSMNLLDYAVTPPSVVTAMVREKARAAGVEVADSEVVGMVPGDLLVREFQSHVGASAFGNAQVLDFRLSE